MSGVRTILVVDDDPSIRMTVRASLERHGFHVVEAASGDEALEVFERDPPDLLMLDIVMPGLSGFEICERIRTRFEHLFTPIIMLTGLEDTDAVKQAYEAGAADFVTKPINYQLMNHRVEHVLRASDVAAELRGSQVRQSHAQRIAHLAHMEWNADSVVTYRSQGLEDILGLTDAASITTVRDLLDILGPEERAETSLALESTIAAHGRHYSLEHVLEKPDGKVRYVVHNAELSYNRHQKLDRVLATFQDITDQRLAEQQIHWLAHFDSLTGLPKRQSLVTYLNQEIEQAKRHERNLAVVVVGIDGLNRYRDALGYNVAEQLISQFAERLKAYCRSSDFVSSEPGARLRDIFEGSSRTARISSGEFAITLSEVHRPEDSRLLVRRIRECLGEQFSVAGHEIVVTTCMGISVFPLDADGAEDLIRAAEVALNVAREHGVDSQQYYTESLNDKVLKKFSLESELRKALEAGDLRLHYQPQQCLKTGEIRGIEALVRWPHATRGSIPPLEFIPIAEQAGLINALGDWVFWTVCQDLELLQREFDWPLRTAINLSMLQFNRIDLVQRMRQILDYAHIAGKHIEVELTETVLMNDVDRSVALLKELRELGCSVAIDDFGTGYSSLTYLKQVPANILKIDRSFLCDLAVSKSDQAIVRGIVQLGHSLSMAVVAEGVEEPEQHNFLRDIDCDVMQGFLLSRPLPYDRLVVWLREQRVRRAQRASVA